MSRLRFVSVTTILLFLLALRFYFFYSNQTILKDGQVISFTSRLMSEPEGRGSIQRFVLEPDRVGKIFVTAPAFPRYQYGQTLAISGNIKQQVLKNDRIVNTMFFPKITSKNEAQNFPINVIFHIREKIRSVFQAALPPASSSLLLGIVFGGKEQLPKDFSENLASTGLIHIIAASGMNVSMVAGGVFFLFSLFFHRKGAIFLTVLAVFFYMLLAGFSPSIVRAGIMATLASIASLLGKQYFVIIALVITAYAMLLFDPRLLFDLGFQLSFSATLGIILLSPFLTFRQKAEKKPVVDFFASDIKTTTAAQIATLPILLATIGQYGVLSIPVNALVLWMVPILMILGGVGALCALFFPFLAKLLLWLALPFLIYIQYIVMYFGKLNLNLSLDSFPVPFVLGYYLLLLVIIFFRKDSEDQSAKIKNQSQAKK